MKRLAKALSEYVVHKGVVKEEEYSIYEYGFLIALEIILSLLISLGIAYALHMVVEGILFFIIFIPLRSYAGGLHMEHYWTCLLLSCLTFTAILIVGKFVNLPVFASFLMLVPLMAGVWFMHPVENVNREVDEDEARYFKKQLRNFLLMDTIIAAFCMTFKKEVYLVTITATFFVVAATMVLGKLKNNRATKI